MAWILHWCSVVTRDDFIAEACSQLRMDRRDLLKLVTINPCSCDARDCEGWEMTSPVDLSADRSHHEVLH